MLVCVLVCHYKQQVHGDIAFVALASSQMIWLPQIPPPKSVCKVSELFLAEYFIRAVTWALSWWPQWIWSLVGKTKPYFKELFLLPNMQHIVLCIYFCVRLWQGLGFAHWWLNWDSGISAVWVKTGMCIKTHLIIPLYQIFDESWLGLFKWPWLETGLRTLFNFHKTNLRIYLCHCLY